MKKNKFLFLVTIFSLFIFVLFFETAFALETKYPETITGSTVTDTSGLAQYLKYVFDFGISLGLAIAVLTITIAGIFYFAAPISPHALEIARDRISGAISGLLILLLTYIIITTINPYLKFFTLTPLDKTDVSDIDMTYSGVNLYQSTDCSGSATIDTNSVSDLGDIKNKIYSVKISQDSNNSPRYFAILYDNTKYWGPCQYIFPKTSCQSVKNLVSAESVNIYHYASSPNGSGYIKIYRKSFNAIAEKPENKSNGYLIISQSDIKRVKEYKLGELRFTGDRINSSNASDCTVPEIERDCIKWNKKGICTERQCPSLDKGNISSIEISGNYLVLLTYLENIDSYSNSDLNDLSLYNYCQAFPTDNDANKIGPQQIKWDHIISSGHMPNHILIVPTEEN